MSTFIEHPIVFQLTLLLISLFAGFLGSVVGLGGGIIIVPALTLGFGIDIKYAIGASIVSVIATSSGAAAVYVKDHITNIKVAMLLEVATSLGALGGAVLSDHVSPSYIYFVFAVILGYSAVMMHRKRHSEIAPLAQADYWARKFNLSSTYPDHQLGREVSYAVTHVPLGFSLMIGAGVISGLLGIGSGALKVPAMDTAMRLPIKVSSATSNFMIGVTACASAGAYYMRGDILPVLAAPVALGVFIGSWFGTKAMIHLPSKQIRTIFIFLLVIIAIQMALKAVGVNIR